MFLNLLRFCTNNRFYKNATKTTEATCLKQTSVESKISVGKMEEDKIDKENMQPPAEVASVEIELKLTAEMEVKQPEATAKLFNSKLNELSVHVDREAGETQCLNRMGSIKRRQTTRVAGGKHSTITRLPRHEEEVWSKVAQKLLESILKRALSFNYAIDLKEQHNFGKSTSSSSLYLPAAAAGDQQIKLNVGRLLFDENSDLFAVISGANIHHNCSHVNKHGVVIDTDGN